MTTKFLCHIILTLALGIVPVLAQTCSCGQKDCLSWPMNCSFCSFTACNTTGATSTDPLDLCQTNVPLKCAIHTENGNKVVCANANKVTQCYQRDLKASGVKCSNNAITVYTTTGCCSN